MPTYPLLKVVDVTSIWSGDGAYYTQQQQQLVFNGYHYFNSGASICRINTTNYDAGHLQSYAYSTIVWGDAGLGNTINQMVTDGSNVIGITSQGTQTGTTKYSGLVFSPTNFTLGGASDTDIPCTIANGPVAYFGYGGYYNGNVYLPRGDQNGNSTLALKISSSTFAETVLDLTSRGITAIDGDALIDTNGNRVFFGAPTTGKLIAVPLNNWSAAAATIVNIASSIPNWSSGVSPSPTNVMMHAWLGPNYVYVLYQTVSGGVSLARIKLADMSYNASFDLTVAYGGNFATAVDRPIDGVTFSNGTTYVMSSSKRGVSDNGVTRIISIKDDFTTWDVHVMTDLNPNMTAGYASLTTDGTSLYSQPVYQDFGTNTFAWQYTPAAPSPPPPLRDVDITLTPSQLAAAIRERKAREEKRLREFMQAKNNKRSRLHRVLRVNFGKDDIPPSDEEEGETDPQVQAAIDLRNQMREHAIAAEKTAERKRELSRKPRSRVDRLARRSLLRT